ncbi:protein phosphatase 2C domain-containing protein [Micromonospora sp. M61]|uniref:protein phosphatase 2C domain-containing protein n=1 Tax=Micromonospora sp. M61 TaxID=2824890 RepID=UPI001B364253|nr:protein phosphatase 2C domain-containing protein [Micromonospora sp. M61]MBQ0979103.1 protein phosphatase 2C domain-containing protein [Micromonospora sp. M61]
MQVAMATSPAKLDQPNEDFTGAIPNAVVLLDGAGLSGAKSTCAHGVAWYTRRLGAALLAQLAADDGQDLTTVLGQAIGQVANAHRGTCDISDPSSPSATVIIFRVNNDRADYLVLADSVLVLDQAGDAPVVITDDREAIVGSHYRAAMDAAVNGTPEHDQARREYIEALRAHRNQPGGFWVAANDAQAASEALIASRPIQDFTSAVLLSDGASRIADRFALTDWPEVLALITKAGPAEVIRQVRAAEASDPHGRKWPRGKTHDDATLAQCTQLGEPRLSSPT